MVMPAQLTGPVLTALKADNVNFNKMHVINTSVGWDATVAQQLGSAADGQIVVSATADPSNASNPGIAQYHAELKKAGYSLTSTNLTPFGVLAWTTVHVIADLMQGAKTFTAAELLARVKTHGPFNITTVPPFNFSQRQFPNNPTLYALKLYSPAVSIAEVTGNGNMKNIGTGYVNLNSKNKISNA
jgi:hypothetical protein